jgi:hypothetical protein
MGALWIVLCERKPPALSRLPAWPLANKCHQHRKDIHLAGAMRAISAGNDRRGIRREMAFKVRSKLK